MEKGKKPIIFLDERLEFPPVEHANSEGLLAVGGDLAPERLLLAYQRGIFPWFNKDSLILWWSPDPRMVLFPDKFKVSKSLRRFLNSERFSVTLNKNFDAVINHCSSVRRGEQQGTWITAEMKQAYIKLNELGIAISYEVWEGKDLVGGLYGLNLGHIFCGESMFSLVSNASKVALAALVKDLKNKGCQLIDCQLYTAHLESLGAEEISRERYMKILESEY